MQSFPSFLVGAVLTVSGSGDGIDCSEGGVDPLPLSPCNSTGGVLLSSLGLCGGGCVTDWTYCYSKTNSTVPVTFALWREVNGLLERVEGSSYEMKMKRLPAEQWFVCEDIPVECGVPILEGDLVGVVIGEGTSVCMLGEMDDGVVMVGGWEEGREGRLTKASLQNVTGQALLVSALAGHYTIVANIAITHCSLLQGTVVLPLRRKVSFFSTHPKLVDNNILSFV